VEAYKNPVWMLLPMIPLVLVSEATGRGIFLIMSLICYLTIARKSGASPEAQSAFLLSPPLLYSLWQGTFEALVLLGLFMLPWQGIWFLTMKPQVGVGPVLYTLVEQLRARQWREMARTFVPIAVVTAITLLIWGFWPRAVVTFHEPLANASPWVAMGSLSAVVGVAIFVAAVKKRNIGLTLWASVFMSPYVAPYSMVALFIPALKSTRASVALFAGMWTITIMYALWFTYG
jgi:hypothetical protein